MSFGVDTLLIVLFLGAITVAPGAGIAIYVHWKDIFDPEPRRLLLRSFFLGMLAIIPPVLIHFFCDWIGFNRYDNVGAMVFYTFIIVAFSEELSKYAILRIYAYPKSDFNEPFDGITYSAMIAMGFATLENVFYVFDGDVARGVEVALLRMVTAVPAHASYGIMMGYFVGSAKFRQEGQSLQFTGIMCAVVAHGLYDFFIYIEHVELLATGALIVLALSLWLSFKAIKLHQQISPFKKELLK